MGPVNGESWWDSPGVKAVLDAERTVISSVLQNVFGYHGLWIAPDSHDSAVSGPFTWLPLSMRGGALHGAMRANVEEWPWQTEAFDVVVLQHVLDQVKSVETLLEEVSRVLSPAGLLLLTAVNPMSLMAAQLRVGSNAPKSLRPLEPSFIRRRVAEHGFNTLGWRACYHGLIGRPIQARWLTHGVGGSYLGLIRKRRNGLVRRLRPQRVAVSATSLTSASRTAEHRALTVQEAA